jgi:2-amino-4-hydroxy-6-hydroxymethyldihydropteridine diphosphokinase
MTTRRAYVALGSNLGDRQSNLSFARERLAALPSTRIAALSEVDETAPLGGLDQPPYLNQMALLETGLSARQLLLHLHEIEEARGRERSSRWQSRTLDLDIVDFEGEHSLDPELRLPHPGLADREFWRRQIAAVKASVRSVDGATTGVELPPWARVSEKRRAHIERVTALLDDWARRLNLDVSEARAWHDAGVWHDALRDADEEELRRWAGKDARPVGILHGPAAAARLSHEGEKRAELLNAIHWHTLGNPDWGRTGKALYMADFLEPGRPFMRRDRAFLAAHVPEDFEGVFQQVVRLRLEWTIREGKPIFAETAQLWNRVL